MLCMEKNIFQNINFLVNYMVVHSMNKTFSMILAFSMLFVFGCAATGPVFKAAQLKSDNNALVYIYRSKDDFGEILDVPHIYVNEKKVSTLRAGGYTFCEVDQGPVNLIIRQSFYGVPIFKGLETDFIATPGDAYFFKLFWYESIDKSSASYQLVPVKDERNALYELKDYKLQN